MKNYAGHIHIIVEHNAIDDELIVKRFEQSMNVQSEDKALQRAVAMILASREVFCAENGLPIKETPLILEQTFADPEHLS